MVYIDELELAPIPECYVKCNTHSDVHKNYSIDDATRHGN